MQFEASNPEFAARIEASFARQQVMEKLGARLGRVAAGEVEIVLPYREDLTQQHGFIHAGVVATVLDSACGYAAFSLMPADAAVLSVEFKINLMAPAVGEELLARGRVVRPGRTVTVCSGDALMRSGKEENTVATMLSSVMAVFGREGVEG